MALKREELFALAKATAKASVNPSSSFAFGDKKLSYEALDTKFREQMNGLAGTYADYRENQNLIFSLLEQSVDEVLPAKVLEQYGQFAEVKTYAENDRPVFNVRISEASRRRARGFVTRAATAGRYETFRLDGYSFTVNTAAYGAAVRLEFEEFLTNRVQMSDLYQLVVEGLNEAVYREIAHALDNMVMSVQNTNKTTQTSFNEDEMDRLLATADAYGQSTIYCTFEFAAHMLPKDSSYWSEGMKEQIWNTGYFATYKGHRVIVLPQSFEDITNTNKVINPQIAYIIPTGTEKPVKIALEGETHMRALENQDDWSKDIQYYKKLGVGLFLVNPGICVYQNTSLSKTNVSTKPITTLNP